VWVDGAPARSSVTVRAGMAIDVEPGARPATSAEPDPSVVLAVVHEDEDLLVVNKPAGLVVHPARGHFTGTLVNGLLARPGFERVTADPRDREGALRPGIVQRLDKDTSGLIVVAKTEKARESLKAEIQAHQTERVYLALTVGVPRAGVIRTFYGRHPRSRLRFTSLLREGKAAVTHVSVREVLASGRAALVECRLETGRTHQIRVHLSEQAKTPILADALYGSARSDAELSAVAAAIGRQALHAAVLSFVHPTSGVRLRFEAPLPADMAVALDALRALSAKIRG